jgi:hypothetical protein
VQQVANFLAGQPLTFILVAFAEFFYLTGKIFKRALHSLKCLFFNDNYFHIHSLLLSGEITGIKQGHLPLRGDTASVVVILHGEKAAKKYPTTTVKPLQGILISG